MIYLDQWFKRLGIGVLLVGGVVLGVLAVMKFSGPDQKPMPTPEQVRHAGAVPVEDASAREVARLVSQVDALKRLLEKVRTELPQARPIATGSVKTEAQPACGIARPDPEPTPGCPVVALEPCLLRNGDSAEVRATGALLDISGRRALIGAAEFWRLTPGPEAKIWGGDLRVDAGEVHAVPPEKPGGWMAGPALGVSGSGIMAGAVLVTPEKRVWRFSGRGVVGLMAGQGDAAVWGGVVFGW